MSATERYARQIVLPEIGSSGQAKLAAARVLLVGLGGLGCPAADHLASSGVGRLVLNDFDRVDLSNLPRQTLFSDEDIGRLKVEAARDRLMRRNPSAEIDVLPERLDEAGLDAAVRDSDVVLDGTDNFATRLAVNRACVRARVPLVSGAALRLEGQIGVFMNMGEGPCYRCLYDEEDEWLGDCQGSGVLGPVPGVIGTLMALEAIKLLVGLESGLRGALLLWDAKSGGWQRIAVRANPRCPECAEK